MVANGETGLGTIASLGTICGDARFSLEYQASIILEHDSYEENQNRSGLTRGLVECSTSDASQWLTVAEEIGYSLLLMRSYRSASFKGTLAS